MPEFLTDLGVASRTRRQAPLLRLAVPMALGFAAARVMPDPGQARGFAAVAAITCAAAVANLAACSRPRAAMLAFYAFAFFGAAAYFLYGARQNPYPDWCARECGLTLAVERCDINAKGAAYGVAKVISAPGYFSKMRGGNVWYYAKDGREVSRRGEITGNFIVRPLDKAEGGGFDEYLENCGIFFKASARSVNASQGGFPYSLYAACREYIVKRLSQFPEIMGENSPGARAYRAMILGDKGLLSPEAKAGFAATGTMHIFAVSGLHVGMLAAVLFGVLNALRVPRKIQPAACLPLLFLYVNACGARPSAMRAFIMIAFVWAAWAVARKPKPFAGLVAAFVFTIAVNPSDLFDAGFALSYSVVAALLLYAVEFCDFASCEMEKRRGFDLRRPPLFRRAARRVLRYALAGLSIAVAALFASAPLSAHYFGYIAPLSVPYSLPYVAAATAVVAAGAFAMALPHFALVWANWAAARVAELMLAGAEAGAQTGLVIDVRISGGAAFAIECAIVASLLLAPKIPGPWKWAAMPAVSAGGILMAAAA